MTTTEFPSPFTTDGVQSVTVRERTKEGNWWETTLVDSNAKRLEQTVLTLCEHLFCPELTDQIRLEYFGYEIGEDTIDTPDDDGYYNPDTNTIDWGRSK